MLSLTKALVKRGFVRWLLWREAGGNPAGRNTPFADLAPENWGCSVSDNHLAMGGVRATDLADAYGTPLHVVDKQHLLDQYTRFLQAFRTVYPNTVLATSYKTNPVPGVLAILHESGSYAEVISHFELWLALQLGIAPEKIIFNGPGKTREGLELAIKERIAIINIDSFDEIDRIAAIAREAGIRQRVGLRILTSVGWSCQFGVRISGGAAFEAFRRMTAVPELIPTGVHLHLGTGIQNISTYVSAIRELLEFTHVIQDRLGIVIDHFDLGGGFGVPTVRTMSDWDLRMVSLGYPARVAKPSSSPSPSDYAAALGPLLRSLATRYQEEQRAPIAPLVILEPGRAVTSACQTLLLRVLGKKKTATGNQGLIVDGGKNITMPLGWEWHQLYAANRMNEPPSGKFDVFGPLCHPGDVIARNLQMPEIQEGDVLAIMDAGAYFIPNQTNFSHPRPPIVLLDDGQQIPLRRRETFSDMVRLDHSIEG